MMTFASRTIFMWTMFWCTCGRNELGSCGVHSFQNKSGSWS